MARDQERPSGRTNDSAICGKRMPMITNTRQLTTNTTAPQTLRMLRRDSAEVRKCPHCDR